MKQTLLLFFMLILSRISFSQIEMPIIWDTIIFDTSSSFISLDTTNTNIWQIGKPQKVIFDSAYSSGICLVTDTLNYYPLNDLSFFELYIGEFNHKGYPWNMFIEFKQKFDTDTLKDGCYITVSYDMGKTWINVFKDENWLRPFNFNENFLRITDTLANGEIGFSGKSNGWLTSTLASYAIPCSLKSTQDNFNDTLIMRFNFYSDSENHNKEGFLIDDIRFYSLDLGGAVKQVEDLSLIKIYPNPTSNNIKIAFYNQYSNIKVDILSLNGNLLYTENFSCETEVELTNLNLENGIYLINCTCDSNQISNQLLILK